MRRLPAGGLLPSRLCVSALGRSSRDCRATAGALKDAPDAALMPVAPCEAVMRCAWAPCGAPVPASVGRCARCRRVGFCGRPHQAAHWKAVHKLECTAVADALVVFKTPAQVEEAAACASEAAAASRVRPAASPLPCWDLTIGPPPVTIMKAWHKAAESGDVRGQYLIGSCHFFGKGVKTDFALAAALFGKAAAGLV